MKSTKAKDPVNTKRKGAAAVARMAKANAARLQRVVKPEDLPLNARQKIFVEEYLSNNWNGTAAARKAGYGQPSSAATENMRRLNIRKAIDERLKAACLSREQILARISEMATGNMADFTTDGVTINKGAVKRKGYLVKKLESRVVSSHSDEDGNGRVSERVSKIELHDSQAALEKLARYYGMLTDKVALTGADGNNFEFVVKLKEEDLP